jgi:long-chain fatty acid transport protein
VRSANPANPASLTVTNWRNAWFGSLGAEYRPDDRWTLRVGTAYDTAAIPKAHLEPRIPGADRYWLSAGVGYKWNEHTEINLAYDHLFAPHSTVRQSLADPVNAAAVRGGLDGVSNTNANLVGLQVTYRE